VFPDREAELAAGGVCQELLIDSRECGMLDRFRASGGFAGRSLLMGEACEGRAWWGREPFDPGCSRGMDVRKM
jgi:hypothetical protein